MSRGDICSHAAMDCVCLSSDRTGAYIHELSIAVPSPDAPSAELSPVPEGPAPESPSDEEDIHSVTRRPGSVPYVSQRAGVYGRLLLATYVRWQTGLLTACDWLWPVTRGVGVRLHQSLQRIWLTSAD